MKVFQELTIGPLNSHDQLEDFIGRIERRLSHDWSRGRTLGEPDVIHSFVYAKAGQPHAILSLAYFPEAGTLKAGVQLTPTGDENITRDEYSDILRDFRRRFVRPAAKEMGIKLHETKPEQSTGDWMSPRTAQLFRRFTAGGSSSRASGHRANRRYWFDFLVAAARTRGPSPRACLLERWLKAQEVWPEDQAELIIGEYQFAMALLPYARNFRYPKLPKIEASAIKARPLPRATPRPFK